MKNILLANVVLLLVLSVPGYLCAQNGNHKVVLLTNDSVMEGGLESVPNGYRIKTTNGITLTLALNDIAVICDSLDEVYELKQFSILPNQPQKHIDLARWCLKNDLLEKATYQVELAAKLSGENSSITMLRQRIESKKNADLEQKLDLESDSENVDSDNAGHLDKVEKQPTLNGRQLDELMRRIPRSVTENFTRYIQSPMASGCTVSGCHLSNKNGFQLSRRSLNTAIPRRMTQRNLITLIDWANRDHIEASELLQKASSAHGELREAVWEVDSRNYQLLKLWIADVQAHRINFDGTAGAGLATNGNQSVARQVAHADNGSNTDSQVEIANGDFVPSVPKENGRTAKPKVIDPFDPAEFNKRYSRKSATTKNDR